MKRTILLLLFLTFNTIFAGQIKLVGKFRTPASPSSMAVSGKYAYVACFDSGLQIINVSNPTSPSLAGKYDNLTKIDRIIIVGNYAYVTDWDSSFQIIDVSNPASPSLRGKYGSLFHASDVAIAGSYAYVATNDSGLQIINVSNPSLPILAGHCNWGCTPIQIAVKGNFAYLSEDFCGLQIINISNPLLPFQAGSLESDGRPYGIATVGNFAYIAERNGGLEVVNISNPSLPKRVGFLRTKNARDIVIVNNYAYVTDQQGIRLINIENPSSPYLACSYDTSNNNNYYSSLAVVGNYAYTLVSDFSQKAGRFMGLKILEVSICIQQASSSSFQAEHKTNYEFQKSQASDPKTEYYKELKSFENKTEGYKGSISFTDGYGRPSKQIDVVVFSRGSNISHILFKMNNLSNSDYANLIAYAPMIESKKYPNDPLHIEYSFSEEMKKAELRDPNPKVQVVYPGSSVQYLFHYSTPHSIDEILSGKARLVIQLSGTMFEIDNLHK